MRERPRDLAESALAAALVAWDLRAPRLAHAPVGFGDHHWIADDPHHGRRFVTVADLTAKEHCGHGVDAARDGLRRAMDTAAALADRPGPDIVVAPLRDVDGATLRPLGERYAVSVFPFVDGVAAGFGAGFAPAERDVVLDRLAGLHRARPPAGCPVPTLGIASRENLEQALGDLHRPWGTGPFADPARAALAAGARGLRVRLTEFDRGLAAVRAAGHGPVLTHGEPHAGNVLLTGSGPRFVDWDTVGLALPERDLWQVAEDDADLARYAAAAGRDPDPAALALYRLRWDLDDVAVCTGWFREPHGATPDTEVGLAGLTEALTRLTS